MDPVFGLPVVKESRAMESARNRNRTQQRRLGSQLTRLHSKLECSTSRILHNKNLAMDLWSAIQPPTPHKNVVCPSGLTNQEKSVYQHMRKSGPLSMSLEEFDKKMEELKNISAQSRQTDKVEKSPKRRRRNSEVVTASTRRGSIVPDEDQIRSLNRKHKMKEALGRLETSDVRVKDQNTTDQYKSTSRRHSSVLPSLPGGSRNGFSDTSRNHSSINVHRRRNSVAVVSLETPRNERLVSASSEEVKQTMEDVKTLMGQMAITLT